MFIKFLLLTTYILNAFGQSCFTKDEITKSNNLFIYKNKVYDINNYTHPKNINIDKIIGNDLEKFVNENKLSFHLKKNRFFEDLKDMHIGSICTTQTTEPLTSGSSASEPLTSGSSTSEPLTSESSTTEPLTSESDPLNTDNELFISNCTNNRVFYIFIFLNVFIGLLL